MPTSHQFQTNVAAALFAEQTRFSHKLLKQRLVAAYALMTRLGLDDAQTAVADAVSREAEALSFCVSVSWEQLGQLLNTRVLTGPCRKLVVHGKSSQQLMAACVSRSPSETAAAATLVLTPEAVDAYAVFSSPLFVHNFEHLGLVGREGAGLVALAQKFEFSDVPGDVPSMWLCPSLADAEGLSLVQKVLLDPDDKLTPFFKRLCARKGLCAEEAQ